MWHRCHRHRNEHLNRVTFLQTLTQKGKRLSMTSCFLQAPQYLISASTGLWWDIKLLVSVLDILSGRNQIQRTFHWRFRMFGGCSDLSQWIEARHSAFPFTHCQDAAWGSVPQTHSFQLQRVPSRTRRAKNPCWIFVAKLVCYALFKAHFDCK